MISAGMVDVKVDKEQLNKTVTNLCQSGFENAADYAPDGCEDAIKAAWDSAMSQLDSDIEKRTYVDVFKLVQGWFSEECNSVAKNIGDMDEADVKATIACTSPYLLVKDGTKLVKFGEKLAPFAEINQYLVEYVKGMHIPSPSDVELPSNLKEWIKNTMPEQIPEDKTAQDVFAKQAERIYRQAMSLLYPASSMINAMVPAGKQIVEEMDADLGNYKGGDAGLKAQTLDNVQHKVPYHIDNTDPYEIKIRLRPDSLTDGYEGKLIPAELIRLLMDGLNFQVDGRSVGEQLTDADSLAQAIKDAVSKLGDADAIAEKLPGLTVKKVDMGEGAVTGVELGPRVGATDVPTFIVNDLNAQNDYAKRRAIDFVYMQALQMAEENMGRPVNASQREKIASEIAPKLEGMGAFQIAAQRVTGRNNADGMQIEQVPLGLIRPIVNTLNEWRRNGIMYDADQVGVITSLTIFYRDGLEKKPSSITEDEMVTRIANETTDVLVHGKGVKYDTDAKALQKARENGRYFRTLVLTGFDENGDPKLTSPKDGGDSGYDNGPWSVHGDAELGGGIVTGDGVSRNEDTGIGAWFMGVNVEARYENKAFFARIMAGGAIAQTPGWYVGGESEADRPFELNDGESGGTKKLSGDLRPLSVGAGYRVYDDEETGTDATLGADVGYMSSRLYDAAGNAYSLVDPVNGSNSIHGADTGGVVGAKVQVETQIGKGKARPDVYARPDQYDRQKPEDVSKASFAAVVPLMAAETRMIDKNPGVSGFMSGLGGMLMLNIGSAADLEETDMELRLSAAFQISSHGVKAWTAGLGYMVAPGKHAEANFGARVGQRYDDRLNGGPRTDFSVGLRLSAPFENVNGSGVKIVPSLSASGGVSSRDMLHTTYGTGEDGVAGTTDDRDGDGIVNDLDQCPDVCGVPEEDGCPPEGEEVECSPVVDDLESDDIDDRNVGSTTKVGPGKKGAFILDFDVILNEHVKIAAFAGMLLHSPMEGSNGVDLAGEVGLKAKVTW